MKVFFFLNHFKHANNIALIIHITGTYNFVQMCLFSSVSVLGPLNHFLLYLNYVVFLITTFLLNSIFCELCNNINNILIVDRIL